MNTFSRFRRRLVAAVSALLLAGLASPAVAQQAATTVQLPSFGISIDAEGVLTLKAFPDPTGRLRLARARAAAAALPGNVARVSPLRKVSLVRLEAAVAARAKAGLGPDEAMRYLAGLQRVKYVFFYPKQNDIVIAGPAEGWMADLSGRIVGVKTGLPVIELEDLVVALRAFAPGGKPPRMIGCTIDPNADGLARLRDFQRRIPRVVRQSQRTRVAQWVAGGVTNSLGMADIRVFGVPADTHFAHVLIEADYRMKLIGIGRERPGAKISSYLDLLSPSMVRHGTLQRWWFTPNYKCVKLTKDRLAMELVGQGVQLQTEDKVILAGGNLANALKPNRASERFTEGFTRNYPQLAARRPVYAQLRNLIDMAVAAAFIQKEDYYGRAGWRMNFFGDEKAFPVQGKPTPKKVAAAANSTWKGSRLLTPAGGGVDIHAELALDPEVTLSDVDGQLKEEYGVVGRQGGKHWWWD